MEGEGGAREGGEKEYERGDDRERERKRVKAVEETNIERRLRRAWREEGIVGKRTERGGGERGLHEKVSKRIVLEREDIRNGGGDKRREGSEEEAEE